MCLAGHVCCPAWWGLPRWQLMWGGEQSVGREACGPPVSMGPVSPSRASINSSEVGGPHNEQMKAGDQVQMRLQTQTHLLKPGRALPWVPREPGRLPPLACCLATTLRHASAGVFPQQLYCFCASGRYLRDDLVTCSGLFSDMLCPHTC